MKVLDFQFGLTNKHSPSLSIKTVKFCELTILNLWTLMDLVENSGWKMKTLAQISTQLWREYHKETITYFTFAGGTEIISIDEL